MKLEVTRGILKPEAVARKFQLTRYLPAPDLQPFIERYWLVQWDLPAPYTQETLPFPCVNVVIELGRSGVWGVVTRKFTRLLEAQGQAFGIKFRPGGFYPFINRPLSQITDQVLCFEDAFGADSRELETIIAPTNHDTQIATVENWLGHRLPEPDENIEMVNQIIDCILADQTINKVDDVVQHFDLSKRTLQRLFSQYVGVSPKWVIMQFRLQEAAEKLAAGDDQNLSALALELGYCDQAHFIRDFKNVIGSTPAQYARNGDA